MNKLELSISDKYLEHQVSLLRFVSGERGKVEKLLTQLQKELKVKLATDLTDFSKARVNRLLKQATGVIENKYADIGGVLDSAALAKAEANFTANTFINIGLVASLPSEAALKALVSENLLQGAPLSAWWKKQSDDLAFKFTSAVRQGVAQGETMQGIIKSVFGSKRLGVPGIGFPTETLRRHASTLVHDSVMSIANNAKMATFRANDDIVKGVRFLATFDSKTSIQCMSYSGSEWTLDGVPMAGTTQPFASPPLHPNCRSDLVPITLTFKELGIDMDEPKGTRASDLGQIPSDTSFDDFLKRHDAAYADNLLGPGRAQMWRDGKLSLSDLVSGTGRPLTLEQLAGKATKDFTLFENVVKYSGKKVGLGETISGVQNVVSATNNYNAKFALTAINDLKGKAYSGAALVNEAKNQAAAISWIKDPARDALKLVTVGSNIPGGGTAMMKQAVQASMDAGYGGRLSLVSVGDMKTLEFYYDKCGFNELKGGILNELVLTPDAAKEFMGKF